MLNPINNEKKSSLFLLVLLKGENPSNKSQSILGSAELLANFSHRHRQEGEREIGKGLMAYKVRTKISLKN